MLFVNNALISSQHNTAATRRPNLSRPPPAHPRTMYNAGRRGSHSCSNRLCFLTGSSVCVSRENDTRQLDRATLVDLVSSCGASVAHGPSSGQTNEEADRPTHAHTWTSSTLQRRVDHILALRSSLLGWESNRTHARTRANTFTDRVFRCVSNVTARVSAICNYASVECISTPGSDMSLLYNTENGVGLCD